MKGCTIIFLCLIYLLGSCGYRKSEIPIAETYVPVRSEAVPVISGIPELAIPDTIYAVPFKVKASPPDTFPAMPFTMRNLSATILNIPEPAALTPGENGIPRPVDGQIDDTLFRVRIPAITIAKDAYSPPNNSQSFSYYSRQQGLPLDDISALATDRHQNLWIATLGAGVIRFDGLNFYQYTDTEGLSHNHIHSVIAASNGDIWLGTRAGGAIRFDGTHFFYYSTNNGLPDNRVEKIFEDSKGTIWLGTYSGISKIEGNSITSFNTTHGLGSLQVLAITEDQKGNIWIGTRGGGVSMYDGRSFFTYQKKNGFFSNSILASITDQKGNVWFVSADNGICRFDGSRFHHYSKETGLPSNSFRAITEDHQGNIWLGSAVEGLSKINNEVIAHFNADHGLINSNVTSFVTDCMGTLWFGTYGSGLGKYRGHIFTHYFERHGLTDSFIRSIAQNDDENIWLGSNSEGVFRFNGTEFVNFTTEHGLSNNRISGIANDKKGNLWFATSGGGVSVFDGEYFSHFNTSNGLPDNFIVSLMADSRGDIWFATRSSGILKFNGNHFLSYGPAQGLSDSITRSITEDKNGNIWIGTRDGGVSVFNGERFIHYKEEGGLIHNNILDVMEDSRGNIWIATNGKGVSRFDGTSFYHYTEREGLVSDFVYALLEDQSGNIWFGTRMGINKLLHPPKDSLVNNRNGNKINTTYHLLPLFKNYTQRNGYIGIGTNSRAMFQDRQGKIWIGANDILTLYNPEFDLTDSVPPTIQIRSVGLFNENIKWEDLARNKDTTITLPNGVVVSDVRFDGITGIFGLPQNLSLPFNNNYITIGFTGTTGNITDIVRYRYILEGLEQQWSSIGQRTEISYGNLSPGKYTFRVRAANNDGVWSDDLTFMFRIRPPAWKTWWAYTGYGILFLLGIYLFHKYQKNKLIRLEYEKQKERILEKEITIARQSAEFKQSFLAKMSHELRTPLTGILGMANLLSQLRLEPKAKEYADDLIHAGESLRETINMILDISKIEAGKIEVKKEDFSLSRIINNSIRLFAPVTEEGVKLESFIDEKIPPYIHTDAQRLSQIIKNLLSNAVKFTQKGTITLNASFQPLEDTDDPESFLIRFEVSDTGKGIDTDTQKKLFTPFYQAHQQEYNPDGTGLGLAICRELTQLLGGEIGVESEPGKGSCFWFTIKSRKGLYVADDADLPDRQLRKHPHLNKKLNILCAEDKPMIQKVVKLMMTAMGHNIVIASDGSEALKLFQPGAFDLILMDIQMPVMDGITATQKLRKMHNDLPPIVGLSANALEGDREKFMNLGMDEYLTKPIREHEFFQVLKKFDLC